MADDYFDAKLALNMETGNVVGSAQAQIYATTDTSYSSPLDITDLAGVPLSMLVASPTGIYPAFKVVNGATRVHAKSGPMVTPLTSVEGSRGEPGPPGDGVDTTGSTSGQVLTSAGAGSSPIWTTPVPPTGIIGAPTDWPPSFPPASHQHTVDQISDSTAVGRSVVKAVDQQAARAAIGAAPSTVISFPGFGTTSGTSAQGNHAHSASSVSFASVSGLTATNAQDAIEQVFQAVGTGGGGGNGGIRVVLYASGAYPAQPASAPPGTLVRFFFGPTPYLGPSWPGIPDINFKVELT